MKIVIAKTAGFCMGVRRAVDLALDAPTHQQPPICTYGPLIHNPQVLGLFAERGVTILNRIPESGSGTVLIRAHGVPPETKQHLKKAGFSVIDATCPRVVKVQSIIKRHARKGFAAIIVGDRDHPEVISLQGFAGPMAHVVGSLEELKALPQFSQAIVVAQTTQNQSAYQEVKAWVAAHRPHYMVFDTICDSTEKRQEEVRRLAAEVDAIVVVGGKNSGNTKRLAEIVSHTGKPVYHVETDEELNFDALSKFQTIGITAGASTPTWIIKRIVGSLEQISSKRERGWRPFFHQVQRLMLLTNAYVAVGAGCLSYAAAALHDLTVSIPSLLMAMFYVMSMHTLNHLTGRAEDQYNEPNRERFYARRKGPLTLVAITAGAIGLIAAYQMGPLPFWTLLAMSLLGLSYNLRLVPSGVLPKLKYRRIRDLPGSKTILITIGWGVVTAGLPVLASSQTQWLGGALAVVWALGIAFGRTAFFDVLDLQGDRIAGKETIPTLIGSKRSLVLIKVVIALIIALMLVGGVSGHFTGLAFLLTLCPALLWWIISAYENERLLSGQRLQFRVESLFVLTGVLTLIYSVVV